MTATRKRLTVNIVPAVEAALARFVAREGGTFTDALNRLAIYGDAAYRIVVIEGAELVARRGTQLSGISITSPPSKAATPHKERVTVTSAEDLNNQAAVNATLAAEEGDHAGGQAIIQMRSAQIDASEPTE